MEILIIYDSVFGNTARLAQAMTEQLGNDEILLSRVTEIKPEQLKGIRYLIVGSPTRAFRPTKEMAEFLKKLPADSLRGIKVAAFDTRMSTQDTNSKIFSGFAKVFGYAAKPMADLLEKKGGILVMAPEGFFVKDSQGPLKEGELERAAGWAKQVMAE